MTATTTRRKQQQEMIHRALLAEEDRRRAAREGFLVTAIAVTHAAAYEPALHHASEEHEEGTENVFVYENVFGLVPDYSISSADALEILQSCT